MLFSACDMRFKPSGDDADIQVQRFDRLESRYLTTGDFSALQTMNTDYPIQTRTLIEKMLQLGEVDAPGISNKFLMFFQDSVLQQLINDVEAEYANMDDINEELNKSFDNIVKWLPTVKRPAIYSQIGALDQSIIVGQTAIGISLDKYMGSNYALYHKYYTPQQRETMQRKFIVPDCVSFYLLSIYQPKDFEKRSQKERDIHVAKVMWVVNQSLEREAFKTDEIKKVNRYMRKHPVTMEDLLTKEQPELLK